MKKFSKNLKIFFFLMCRYAECAASQNMRAAPKYDRREPHSGAACTLAVRPHIIF